MKFVIENKEYKITVEQLTDEPFSLMEVMDLFQDYMIGMGYDLDEV